MHRVFILLFSFVLTCVFTVSAGSGYLGVRLSETGHGVTIIDLLDDAPATVYDIRPNDIIVRINDEVITGLEHARELLSQLEWGQPVALEVIRDARPMHVKAIAGYAAATRTWEILKAEQIDGSEHWYFNDNTTIVMNNGSAVSMTRKGNDGVKRTHVIGSGELPQHFSDLNDKLDIIEYAAAEMATKGQDADRITFIRNFEQPAPSGNVFSRFGEASVAMSVYPNPTSGPLELLWENAESASGDLTWVVYDVKGAPLLNGTRPDFRSDQPVSMNISSLEPGYYLISVVLNGVQMTHRVLKR